jgi:beta-glucosidase
MSKNDNNNISMLKKYLIFSLITLGLSVQGQDNEKKIDDLIKQMTVEEKVGQMTQITLDVVCEGVMFDEKKKQVINPGKLSEALNTYKVGSN